MVLSGEMIGRLFLVIECGLIVLCFGKRRIVPDKQTFDPVNGTYVHISFRGVRLL